MKIELRECALTDGNDILDMIREIGPGENGFINDGYDMKDSDFGYYLARNASVSQGVGLAQGWVPQTRYWLMINGRPVGIGKLRHYLNDNLRKTGGHIGYCIRPSERGKGLGIILLAEMLKKAGELGIPKALITCNATNIPSRRVIESNGGKLEKAVGGECHYWIKLDESTGIREIHPDDYGEIVELWKRTAGMGLNDADSEEGIRRFLFRNRGLSFCQKINDRIIATILCGHDGRRGYIYHVAVAREYRGRGIGKGLVEAGLKQLEEAGINKCHLFVFADNETGNAFWQSTGWTKRNDIFVYSKNT